VEAGFRLVVSIVDSFERWAVEQGGHGAEVDAVLGKMRLSSSHSKAMAEGGVIIAPRQYICQYEVKPGLGRRIAAEAAPGLDASVGVCRFKSGRASVPRQVT
jgi:hypothetical protein